MKTRNLKYLVIAILLYFSSTVIAQDTFTLDGTFVNNDTNVCQVFKESVNGKEWDYVGSAKQCLKFTFSLASNTKYLIIVSNNKVSKYIYASFKKASYFLINVDLSDDHSYMVYYDSTLADYKLLKFKE